MYDDPLAYFITWTNYGTYLPGDERGWTKWRKGDQLPDPQLKTWCRDRLKESALFFDEAQREIVNDTVRRHCEIRRWFLHAVNCRSNHCHVVVTAPNYAGDLVRKQFKSWAKRKLKASGLHREKFWTRGGSVRHLFEEDSLANAIAYTLDAQDIGGSKANE